MGWNENKSKHLKSVTTHWPLWVVATLFCEEFCLGGVGPPWVWASLPNKHVIFVFVAIVAKHFVIIPSFPSRVKDLNKHLIISRLLSVYQEVLHNDGKSIKDYFIAYLFVPTYKNKRHWLLAAMIISWSDIILEAF